MYIREDHGSCMLIISCSRLGGTPYDFRLSYMLLLSTWNQRLFFLVDEDDRYVRKTTIRIIISVLLSFDRKLLTSILIVVEHNQLFVHISNFELVASFPSL